MACEGHGAAWRWRVCCRSRRAETQTLLNDQGVINSAVHDLAQVVFPLPTADAGDDQKVETLEPTASVTLNAARSQAAAGQRIVRYIWEEIEA